MGVTIENETASISVLRITGVLKKSEFEQIQARAKEKIKREGKIRTLVILEDFQGWNKSDNWNDMSFFAEYGDMIEKIAIVGDPKWKDQMLMFAGAGLRAAPVHFFSSDQEAEARVWVGLERK